MENIKKLLSVKDLKVQYVVDNQIVKAVNGISFELNEGESLGLVGETGAGKTTTARAIMNVIQTPPGEIVAGEIIYKGINILKSTNKEIRKIRGFEIALISQDPMTSLNPILTIGNQIAETLKVHHKNLTKKEIKNRAIEMLKLVDIEESRYKDYPHQFSGGQKQRAIIAMALSCEPNLLIADEPTTALDVTIQAQVIDLMLNLKNKLKTSLILITHDLGVIASMCDKVAVMYAGEIIEYGAIEQIYENTSHPYTKGLFNSLPDIDSENSVLRPIKGETPDPTNLPSGCLFHPRCELATEKCAQEEPTYLGKEHLVKCFYPLNEVKQ